MPYIINDCTIHSINNFFRHPIFTTRDQVHRLAMSKSKRAIDYVVSRKIEDAYALSLFNHFVVKGN